MTVRFLAEAEVELADGVAYYDGLLSGLGIEFASEVRDGLARVGGSTAFLVAKRKLAQMHFRIRGAGRHAMTAPGSTTCGVARLGRPKREIAIEIYPKNSRSPESAGYAT